MRAPASHCDLRWSCRVAAASSGSSRSAVTSGWSNYPMPPYIRREPEAADSTRYQSLFARKHGAVAAPTASLHFDQPLLAALHERGVQTAFVTLHVGAGTFQPVRTDAVGAHVMHAEFVEVNADACAAVAAARARGARIVAVGTT